MILAELWTRELANIRTSGDLKNNFYLFVEDSSYAVEHYAQYI